MSDIDGFKWFCFQCGGRVHRVELRAEDIVKDLPSLSSAFYGDEAQRCCRHRGTLYPSRESPPGRVQLSVA